MYQGRPAYMKLYLATLLILGILESHATIGFGQGMSPELSDRIKQTTGSMSTATPGQQVYGTYKILNAGVASASSLAATSSADDIKVQKAGLELDAALKQFIHAVEVFKKDPMLNKSKSSAADTVIHEKIKNQPLPIFDHTAQKNLFDVRLPEAKSVLQRFSPALNTYIKDRNLSVLKDGLQLQDSIK